MSNSSGDSGGGRLVTDGGTDDDVAEIKQLLESEGEGEVDVDEDDEDFESSAAMDFGMKVGAPFALVAVGLLFVGPTPLLEFDFGGQYVIDTLDVGGPGNIVYISALTLALAFGSGLLYPSLASEVDDEFKMDLGLGLAVPTLGLLALLVLVFMFWPALWALMNGAIVEALLIVVVAVVILAIAFAGSIITLVIAAIATLYIVGPALVGSYVGGFLGEVVAT